MWRMNKGIVKDLLPQAPLPPQIGRSGGMPCCARWPVWVPGADAPPVGWQSIFWQVAVRTLCAKAFGAHPAQALPARQACRLLTHTSPPAGADPWWVVHVVNLTEGEYRQLDPAGERRLQATPCADWWLS